MRVQRLLLRFLWVVTLTMMAGALPAFAQVTTGALVGTVTDAQGQVVPGAPVTIKNVSQGTSTTVHTDDNGAYAAPFLNPGTYEITIEVQGFRKLVHPDVVIQVNSRVRVDAALDVVPLGPVTLGRTRFGADVKVSIDEIDAYHVNVPCTRATFT